MLDRVMPQYWRKYSSTYLAILGAMAVIRFLIVEDEVLIAEDIRANLTNEDYEVEAVVYNKKGFIRSLAPNLGYLTTWFFGRKKHGCDLCTL